MGHKLNPKVIHFGKESDYRNGRESSGSGVGGQSECTAYTYEIVDKLT